MYWCHNGSADMSVGWDWYFWWTTNGTVWGCAEACARFDGWYAARGNSVAWSACCQYWQTSHWNDTALHRNEFTTLSGIKMLNCFTGIQDFTVSHSLAPGGVKLLCGKILQFVIFLQEWTNCYNICTSKAVFWGRLLHEWLRLQAK